MSTEIVKKYLDDLVKINLKEVNVPLMNHNGLGVLMALAYEDFFFDSNKRFENISNILERLSTKLRTEVQSPSYCEGLCGFAWTLNHLSKNRLIEMDLDSFNTSIDEVAKIFADKSLKLKNHDFLYGTVGANLYLLDRESPDLADLITEIHQKIIGQSIRSKSGLYWEDPAIKRSSKKVINLGLAHGVSGMIVYLCRMVKHFGKDENLLSILKNCTKFIKNCKNKRNSGSIYPAFMINGKGDGTSRLAWCYGDLSVGLALFQAGMALNDSSLQEEGISIFRSAGSRRTVQETGILDASICHGTSGIALMYNRMYKNTGMEEFKKTAYYWAEQTLNFIKVETGLINYKSWEAQEQGWKIDNGLLNGSSGVAMTLMSIYSDKDYDWDRCLLLC